tara:strand:+ start:138 stop:380 length:243 start_codon:yes stop_codon:yes gene_type:complete
MQKTLKTIKMEDGIKNIRLTETRAQMTFCSSCKTCPSIDISTESDKVIIGGDDEGYTEFTKDQFELFMNQIKKGTFDKYL